MIGNVGLVGRVGLITRRPRAIISTPPIINPFLGAAAVYSMRLNNDLTYSGPLLKLRRTSDNTELDIGAFAGTGDGNGNRWLDLYAVQQFITPGTQLGQTLGQVTNAATGQTFNGLNTFAMVETTAVNNHGSYTSGTTATPFHVSTFIRRGSGARNLFMGGTNAGQERGIVFDLGTGTMTPLVVGTGGNTTGVTGVMIPVDAVNGWWYCEVVCTTNGGATSVVFSMTNGTTLYYPGDGSSSIIHTGPRRALTPTSGLVSTWYDISGNGRNLTQATLANQPRIVNAGALETSRNRPAIFTPAGTSMLNDGAGWLVTGNADRAMNAVVNRQSGSVMAAWSGVHSANQAYGLDNSSSGVFIPYTFGAGDARTIAIAALTPCVMTASRSNGVSTGFLNGTQRTTNATAINTVTGTGIGIGLRPGSVNSIGWYSEISYFPSALSTDARQALERGQGTAFGITVA